MNKQPYYHTIGFSPIEKDNLPLVEDTIKKVLPKKWWHTVDTHPDETLFTFTKDITQQVKRALIDNGVTVEYCEAEPGDPCDLM
jgi:hypothetical protein